MKYPFATRCRGIRPGIGFSLFTDKLSSLAVAMGLVLSQGTALGEVGLNPDSVRNAAAASGLTSLGNVPLPEIPNLAEFLNPEPQATAAAIVLGKSLFWDMQAGSDGQACASCHFHAGADNRARNQLTPTGATAGFTPEGGDPENPFFGDNLLGVPGFPQFQPDYTLLATNFPFHQLQDPEENNFFSRVRPPRHQRRRVLHGCLPGRLRRGWWRCRHRHAGRGFDLQSQP